MVSIGVHVCIHVHAHVIVRGGHLARLASLGSLGARLHCGVHVRMHVRNHARIRKRTLKIIQRLLAIL